MATWSLRDHITGRCVVNLNIYDEVYESVSLKIMKNLCTDILLGQDFQSQHKQVVFKFDGSKKELVVPRNVCALSNANAAFPSLFSNVFNNCKPIAVKSRQFNKRDLEFITDEKLRLSSEEIIQPSVSP